MEQANFRIEKFGAVLEITPETIMQNFLESLQKQQQPIEIAALRRRDVPRIGEYWKGQGGFNGGWSRGGKDNPDHFLIVNPDWHVESLKWGGDGIEEPGAQDEFDGLANTNALCASKHNYPAAQWCREQTFDGFSDLYLAARRECLVLSGNVPELMPKKPCWTSTQSSAITAWLQGFDDGYQYNDHENNEFAVVPVRRFIPLFID